jgi:hypothetical protein
MNPGPPVDTDFPRAVQLARANRDFLDALQSLLDEATPTDHPPCEACGQCCDFASAGHRLYLSTGEFALLAEPPIPAVQPLRCPFLVDRHCTRRTTRSLGCRQFFCRADPPESAARYEIHHKALQDLHRRHAIPYHYRELTAGLGELGRGDFHS